MSAYILFQKDNTISSWARAGYLKSTRQLSRWANGCGQDFSQLRVTPTLLMPGAGLNQATQHWYSTGSGSDRAPFGECVSVGARSLPLPVLYHRMYQCCLVRFRTHTFEQAGRLT